MAHQLLLDRQLAQELKSSAPLSLFSFEVGLPLLFLVDRFYSSTFAYTLATCIEGDEEAVEEVKMILMLENFLIEVAGRQPELFLWPKDLIKPDLQINLIVNEQVVSADVDNMNRFTGKTGPG